MMRIRQGKLAVPHRFIMKPAPDHDCCSQKARPVEVKKSCCGGHDHGEVTPSAAAKYFCPMCPGIESDQPGDCTKCGMALERNPAWKAESKTIYTCPMHPEVRQDHPGDCPKCGMALEPQTVAAEAEEDDPELRDMTQRFTFSLMQ